MFKYYFLNISIKFQSLNLIHKIESTQIEPIGKQPNRVSVQYDTLKNQVKPEKIDKFAKKIDKY